MADLKTFCEQHNLCLSIGQLWVKSEDLTPETPRKIGVYIISGDAYESESNKRKKIVASSPRGVGDSIEEALDALCKDIKRVQFIQLENSFAIKVPKELMPDTFKQDFAQQSCNVLRGEIKKGAFYLDFKGRDGYCGWFPEHQVAIGKQPSGLLKAVTPVLIAPTDETLSKLLEVFHRFKGPESVISPPVVETLVFDDSSLLPTRIKPNLEKKVISVPEVIAEIKKEIEVAEGNEPVSDPRWEM